MDIYANKDKSLESLENITWDVPTLNEQSFLIKKCYELRKKQIGEFSIEDFRIMISQGIGLKYLVPLVLDILAINLFEEGDYYEGDLLQSLSNIQTDFWNDNADYWYRLNEITKNRRSEISELKIDMTKFDSAKA